MIGPAGNGTEAKKKRVTEGKFALKNVALRQAKFAFEIEEE